MSNTRHNRSTGYCPLSWSIIAACFLAYYKVFVLWKIDKYAFNSNCPFGVSDLRRGNIASGNDKMIIRIGYGYFESVVKR